MRTFTAIPRPSSELIGEVARLTPHNPFATPQYAAARLSLGAEPWLLVEQEAGRVVVGCLALVATGRLSVAVEVPSWPGAASGAMAEGLQQWCSERSASRLELNTFASEAGTLPWWAARSLRRARAEFVLDLTRPDLVRHVSGHHARNIKRADKAGVRLERSSEPSACRQHAVLMRASLARRQARGEDVATLATLPAAASDNRGGGVPCSDSPADRLASALLTHGAGELFQAVTGGRVLSSILVLRATKGGYYHSAGTTPEGMACGASHWLVQRVAETLQAEGLERFNLGGAHEEGLVRFKSGFGGERVELEAAEVVLASALGRILLLCARSVERLMPPIRRRTAWRGAREGTR